MKVYLQWVFPYALWSLRQPCMAFGIVCVEICPPMWVIFRLGLGFHNYVHTYLMDMRVSAPEYL